MGYLGLKKLFDKCQIAYGSRTIINSKDLIEKLQPSICFSSTDATVMSLGVEAMYPSISFGMVKKAVDHYTAAIPTEERATVSSCLEMIKFGMGQTLLTYQDKNYEYDGDVPIESKGLTIGGFESAWLADLVASYLLEESRSLFSGCLFDGIYRDDGFVVFRGLKTCYVGSMAAKISNASESFNRQQ